MVLGIAGVAVVRMVRLGQRLPPDDERPLRSPGSSRWPLWSSSTWALWRGSDGRPTGMASRTGAASHGPGPAEVAADRRFEGWRRGSSLIVVVLAWEILGIDSGPHQYHLTISALAQAYRPLNAALLLVWVLIGIGYEAARAPSADRKQSGTPRRATTRGSGPWWRLCSGDGITQCPSRRAGVAVAAESARRRRFLGFRPSRRGAHRLGRPPLGRPHAPVPRNSSDSSPRHGSRTTH